MSLYNLQFQPPYESTNAVDLPSGHQTQWENPRGLAMEVSEGKFIELNGGFSVAMFH
jgi:hypothetical protein